MGGFEVLWIGRAILLLQLVPGILGWGKEGHYTICKIAEGYLSEDASAAVKELLPDRAEGDLASVCSWADEIRFHFHWSGPLHYVDTPDFSDRWSKRSPKHQKRERERERERAGRETMNATQTRKTKKTTPDLGLHFRFDEDRRRRRSGSKTKIEDDVRRRRRSGDCHDTAGHKNRCVTGAIYNYTMQLMSYSDSNSEMKYNLTEALMFLSHFIGDVHQPLHVGFLGDEGGNTITIRWYKRKTNLHHVWDTMIIESALKTFYSKDLSIMIQAIQKNITDGWSDEFLLWEGCALDQTVCPDPYASESINLACKFAYRNATPGSTLGDDYFLSRLPVVEKRLAQSGVRLAATLNRIFSSRPSISQE